jgi:hypothetical protein
MELSIVRELANIVTKHKIKDISILSTNNSSKSNALYNLLITEEDITEQDLITKLKYSIKQLLF